MPIAAIGITVPTSLPDPFAPKGGSRGAVAAGAVRVGRAARPGPRAPCRRRQGEARRLRRSPASWRCAAAARCRSSAGGAGAEGGVQVALVDRGVVAVPVELHAPARPSGARPRGSRRCRSSRSAGASVSMGKLSRALGALKVSTRPGPQLVKSMNRRRSLSAGAGASRTGRPPACRSALRGVSPSAAWGRRARARPCGVLLQLADLAHQVLGVNAGRTRRQEERTQAPMVVGVGGHAEDDLRLGSAACPVPCRCGRRRS